MRSIEEKIDIPESRKDDFRREIMNYIGALALDGKKFDYKTNERLQKALELKLFEDQKDTIKLTSLVSSVVDKETQEKIDVVKSRLIRNYGYDEDSATDVLNYVASIFARGDVKRGSRCGPVAGAERAPERSGATLPDTSAACTCRRDRLQEPSMPRPLASSLIHSALLVGSALRPTSGDLRFDGGRLPRANDARADRYGASLIRLMEALPLPADGRSRARAALAGHSSRCRCSTSAGSSGSRRARSSGPGVSIRQRRHASRPIRRRRLLRRRDGSQADAKLEPRRLLQPSEPPFDLRVEASRLRSATSTCREGADSRGDGSAMGHVRELACLHR